jgi:hypothetical protein
MSHRLAHLQVRCITVFAAMQVLSVRFANFGYFIPRHLERLAK